MIDPGLGPDPAFYWHPMRRDHENPRHLVWSYFNSRKTLCAIINYYNSHLISAVFSFPFVNKHVRENVLELLKLISAYIFLSLACSGLSDSGEDAKERGTRKVSGEGKSFLPFYFRVCAFSIQRTRLSRSLEQAILSCTTLYSAFYLTLVRLYVCANKFGSMGLVMCKMLATFRKRCRIK